MEKLVCNECGTEFTDEESIIMAKMGQERWKAVCKESGDEPRGIAPCPIIKCPGELILKEE